MSPSNPEPKNTCGATNGNFMCSDDPVDEFWAFVLQDEEEPSNPCGIFRNGGFCQKNHQPINSPLDYFLHPALEESVDKAMQSAMNPSPPPPEDKRSKQRCKLISFGKKETASDSRILCFLG
jgi:hypothetical protein